MATFTPDYNAGDTVWIITTTTRPALTSGIIIQAIATELTSGTTFTYDVRLNGDAGTTRVAAVNISGTLEQGIAEYYDRLGGTTLPAGSPSTLTLVL